MEREFKLAYNKALLFFALYIPLFLQYELVTKSTNNSGLWRHIGFTENFRGAAELESRLQYLSAVLLGRVVQSRVNITQGKCEILIQIWKLKKHFSFNSLCLQVDDWKL